MITAFFIGDQRVFGEAKRGLVGKRANKRVAVFTGSGRSIVRQARMGITLECLYANPSACRNERDLLLIACVSKISKTHESRGFDRAGG